MKNEEGQGVLELIACMALTLTIIPALLIALYSAYSKSLINFELQRTALCIEKLDSSAGGCIKKSRKTLKEHLWFHSKYRLTTNKSFSGNNSLFQTKFLGKDIIFKKHLKVKR